MRQVKKVRAKYGKLTVVAEETRDGRRYAVVNCKCGAQKYVLVDALTSGRTRSCGALQCKAAHSRVKAKKSYTPRGSKEVPLATLKKIWKAVHRDKAPLSVASAARAHGVENMQTLYSALRSVRLCGGIDNYEARMQQ